MKLVDANLKLHQTLGIAMGISEEVDLRREGGERDSGVTLTEVQSIALCYVESH